MARSTSLNPNRCVTTLSRGKRPEASCLSASSHALKLWPRALLMVMNFSVSFAIGKFGNSFISPCTTMVPPLRLSASTPSITGRVPAPAVQSSTTSTPLPPVIALIRARGSSVVTSITKSAPSCLAMASRAPSFAVPVTIISEAPACLQTTVCDRPCWPGPWISTVES